MPLSWWAVQPATTAAQDVLFLSTQLRPVEEATKMRQAILKGAGPVTFVVEEPPQFTVRMQAETEAGKRTVSLIGALHGEIGPLVPMGALQPIDDVATKLAGRGIPASLMQLGKLGTPITFSSVAYPIFGHNATDPVRRRDVQEHWIGWLERYLNDTPAPGGGR